jgi:hypothetical protein
MNNISNLSLLLFGLCFSSVILVLIIICVRVAMNKKAFNGAAGFFVFLAILSLLGGVGSILYRNKIPTDIQTLKVGNLTPKSGKIIAKVTTSKSSSNSSKTVISKPSSSGGNTSKPFVEEPFDPTGSVRPKIIKDDTLSGIGAIIDADGTKTCYHLMYFPYDFVINPDKSAYGYADYEGNDENPNGADLYLFVPNGKSVPGKGNGCTQYSFTYDSTDQSDNITQCDSYFTNDLAYTKNYDDTGNMQTLNNSTMTPHDFLNQKLPDENPTKPITNHILNGKYSYTDKQIVSTTTPIELDFEADSLIAIRNDYTNMNNFYSYKLESVGKNAYKLYLYLGRV